jgi:dihydrofolate reductase
MAGKIIAIAAVEAKTGAIGYKGGLLYKNRNDMQHFKAATTGHIVVAGRATIKSLGGCWPLQNRLSYAHDRVQVGDMAFYMVDRARAMRSHAKSLGKDLYIIGGGKTYLDWLPHCDLLDLTLVHDAAAPTADSFFPLAEATSLFQRQDSGSCILTTSSGLAYEFSLWGRRYAS